MINISNSIDKGDSITCDSAEHGHRTYRNTSPPFLQLGKRRPRGPGWDLGDVRLTVGTAYPLNVFG